MGRSFGGRARGGGARFGPSLANLLSLQKVLQGFDMFLLFGGLWV
jgi:hypothetical protein